MQELPSPPLVYVPLFFRLFLFHGQCIGDDILYKTVQKRQLFPGSLPQRESFILQSEVEITLRDNKTRFLSDFK